MRTIPFQTIPPFMTACPPPTRLSDSLPGCGFSRLWRDLRGSRNFGIQISLIERRRCEVVRRGPAPLKLQRTRLPLHRRRGDRDVESANLTRMLVWRVHARKLRRGRDVLRLSREFTPPPNDAAICHGGGFRSPPACTRGRVTVRWDQGTTRPTRARFSKRAVRRRSHTSPAAGQRILPDFCDISWP